MNPDFFFTRISLLIFKELQIVLFDKESQLKQGFLCVFLILKRKYVLKPRKYLEKDSELGVRSDEQKSEIKSALKWKGDVYYL